DHSGNVVLRKEMRVQLPCLPLQPGCWSNGTTRASHARNRGSTPRRSTSEPGEQGPTLARRAFFAPVECARFSGALCGGSRKRKSAPWSQTTKERFLTSFQSRAADAAGLDCGLPAVRDKSSARRCASVLSSFNPTSVALVPFR